MAASNHGINSPSHSSRSHFHALLRVPLITANITPPVVTATCEMRLFTAFSSNLIAESHVNKRAGFFHQQLNEF